MADQINAKGADSKFRPHPEGQFVGKCVDVIDLGEKVEDYIGKPKKLSQKCQIVFRTGELNEETGEIVDVSGEYTVSMGEKANLRKILASWRGKEYSEEECEAGVPLHKLVGNFALLTVDQKLSGSGRKYARILSVTGIPKQMRSAIPTFEDYKRAEYWEERKADYKKEADAFRASFAPEPKAGRLTGPNDGDPGMDYPGDMEDDQDSDLPF